MDVVSGHDGDDTVVMDRVNDAADRMDACSAWWMELNDCLATA